MKNIFDVHKYVEEKYGQEIIENYEEDFGNNGLDLLWECEDEKEVDFILECYLEE